MHPIKILDSEKKIFCNETNKWHFSIDGKEYLFKSYFESETKLYTELFYEQVAHALQIPSVHYELAFYQGKKGLLTETYNPNHFEEIPLQSILSYFYFHIVEKNKDCYPNRYCAESCNNLDDIWQALEYYYFDKKNKNTIVLNLMTSILESFILQICTANEDLHAENLVILNAPIPQLAPNFDYGFCGSEHDFYSLGSSTFSEFLHSRSKVLQDFFSQASMDDKNLFFQKVNLLPDAEVIFSILEKEYGVEIPQKIKLNIQEIYERNKRNIALIVENLQSRLR